MSLPVIVCLCCGHAHPAKVWHAYTDPNGRHPGVCSACLELALERRGGCSPERGCLCVAGHPALAPKETP